MGRRSPAGIGIGLRREHYDEIVDTDASIPWLEFIPENHIDRGGRDSIVLRACAERWPLVPHGVSTNLGGPDPLDLDYLRRLRTLLDRIDAPWYSDHLCYCAAQGHEFFDLLPLPFTEAAVRHVAARVRTVADVLERPILLENITYYATMPGSVLTEPEFVTAVLERADCGLLLDLNNLFINAKNHGHDPNALLDAMPLDRVGQVHLAGHSVEANGRLLDDHSAPATEAVLALYRRLLARIGPVPTLFEWDTCVPPLVRVVEEARHAAEYVDDPQPSIPPEPAPHLAQRGPRCNVDDSEVELQLPTRPGSDELA